MTKCFILFLLICLSVPVVYSQEWTKKDSLNLSRVLKEEGEIKLNPEAVKQIDFGSDIMGTPLMSTEKNWMLPDESLPSALPNTLPLEKSFLCIPIRRILLTTGIRFIRKRYK